ncbi:MAG: DUF6259 domain-containing protein [Limnochordia bacterium]|nr:DUF6259 domain-containing protein [Limnochordia bacterium]
MNKLVLVTTWVSFVLFLLAIHVTVTEAKANVVLSNRYLQMVYDPQIGRIVSLLNQETKTEYLLPSQISPFMIHVDPTTSNMWEATSRETLRFDGAPQWTLQKTDAGQQLVLQYYHEEYQISAVLSIEVETDAFTRWQLELENTGTTTIVRIDYPQLTSARAAFPHDRLVWPEREGQIVPTPQGINEIVYPGVASMQWLLYGNKQEGLYMAVYDLNAEYKTLRYQGAPMGIRFSFSLWPFLEPGNKWSAPLVEVGVKQDQDWYWGAERYRNWLTNEAGWTIESPQWVEEMTGFGVQFIKNSRGELIMPFNELPLEASRVTGRGGNVLEIKGWHLGGFDTIYPEYVPSEKAGGAAGLRQATQAINAAGRRLIFYNNTRIANKVSPWYQEQATDNDVKAIDGRTYDEHWAGYTFSVMSPTAKGWQDKLVEHQEFLVDIGGSGMFFDQVGAMHPVLDYNQSHESCHASYRVCRRA